MRTTITLFYLLGICNGIALAYLVFDPIIDWFVVRNSSHVEETS